MTERQLHLQLREHCSIHSMRRIRMILAGCFVFALLANPDSSCAQLIPVFQNDAIKYSHIVPISGDGRYVAVNSEAGVVVWDLDQNKIVRQVEGNVEVGALSKDASYLAVVSKEQERADLVIWNLLTGERTRYYSGAANRHGSSLIAFSEDNTCVQCNGRQFAVIGRGKSKPIDRHGDSKLFGTDAKCETLAVAGETTGTVELFDTKTGESKGILKHGHSRFVRLSMSADGKLLAIMVRTSDYSADALFRIEFWNVQAMECVKSYDLPKDSRDTFSLSPDGKRFVTFERDDRLSSNESGIFRDVESLKPLLKSELRSYDSFAISANSPTFVAIQMQGDSRYHIVRWRLETGEQISRASIAEANCSIQRAQVSGDLTRILVQGSFPESPRLKSLTGEKPSQSRDMMGVSIWDSPSQSWIGCIQGITDDNETWDTDRGGTTIANRGDKTIELVDTAIGKIKRKLLVGSSMTCVRLSGDGKVAAACVGKEIVVFNTTNGKRLQKLKVPDKDVVNYSQLGAMAINGDGSLIAVSGSGSKQAILIFDALTGELKRTLRNQQYLVGMDMTADGKFLAVEGDDINVWDIEKELWIGKVASNPAISKGFALLGSGRQILQVRRDHLELLDIKNGREICSIYFKGTDGDCLCVTPDGLFDGSREAVESLAFIIPGTLETRPAELFQQTLWRPGLLGQLLRGFEPEKPDDVISTLPPEVGITMLEVEPDRLSELKLRVQASERENSPIQKFRLLVDGRPFGSDIEVSAEMKKPSTPGGLAFEVQRSLVPGSHRVRMVAYTDKVHAVSDEVLVRITGDAPTTDLRPELNILAIGISEYQDQTRTLNFADDDALALQAALTKCSSGLFASIDSKVITNQDATRRGIYAGLEWLRDKMQARTNSVGIVFFAGHGVKGDDSDALYFLTHDSQSNNLASTAIQADSLRQQLNSIPGRLLVVLDSCHSAEIVSNRTRSQGELTDQLLRDLTAEDSGLIVLCSSLGNQKSIENEKLGHGVFTSALIEALEGKALLSKDGAVYVDSIIAYVSGRVRELSSGNQIPVSKRPATVRDFPISRPK